MPSIKPLCENSVTVRSASARRSPKPVREPQLDMTLTSINLRNSFILGYLHPKGISWAKLRLERPTAKYAPILDFLSLPPAPDDLLDSRVPPRKKVQVPGGSQNWPYLYLPEPQLVKLKVCKKPLIALKERLESGYRHACVDSGPALP